MKHLLLLFAFLLLGLAAQAQTTPKGLVSIFPNPASEFISVNDQTDQVGSLAVFNMLGKRVKQFDVVKGENYPIADLPKGMYLIQLIDKHKRVITTQKVDKR
jgi:hypothetical protein